VVGGALALPGELDGPSPVGILDLQGDVREHLAAFEQFACPARLVKRPADLEGIVGLVLPGGESTTLSMLLESTGLYEGVLAAASAGLPVLGTCAGLVLVATRVLDGRPDQRTFGLVDVVVRRNGYGRQVQSFEAELPFGSGEAPALPAVFIRAPLIVAAGQGVDVLATFDGAPVLVRQGNVLAASFHPELTPDRRVHQMFAEMCAARRQERGDRFGDRPSFSG
jgi:pyridoxal 5'-phosphate synthase pdxT subunit